MPHMELRSRVVDILKRDLFGPYAEGEAFEANTDTETRETPATRYSTGILFPQEATEPPASPDVQQERDTALLAEQEAGDAGDLGQESDTSPDDDEGDMALSSANRPSCFGISFACQEKTKNLQIQVSAAKYTIEQDSQGTRQWRRQPLDLSPVTVPVCDDDHVEHIELVPDLELRVRFRQMDSNATPPALPITVSLLNTAVVDPARRRDRDEPSLQEEVSLNSFFQCGITVSSDGEADFVERPRRDMSDLDDEIKAAELLYRHVKTFADGHGCAARWDEEDGGRASRVEADFIPEYDLYPMAPPEIEGMPLFSLRRIIGSTEADLEDLFSQLTDCYETWLTTKQPDIQNVPASLQDVAEEQYSDCQRVVDRIRRGVAFLTDGRDPHAFDAFHLAHKAMLEVFARAEQKRKKTPTPDTGEHHRWHPFQIAFILQCIESSANPDSSDRDLADLLWFPTGGGKTEAYLGLAAFLFFLRRLRAAGNGEKGDGVSVLMRYTLRLLTADQFARASTMICACEAIRRHEPSVSETAPVRIGLWVGNTATPGSYHNAWLWLQAKQNHQDPPDHAVSPQKLRECPWCATELGLVDYVMAGDNSPLRIVCPNADCEFHNGEGIPALVIDDQIYEERPALVIGTIDKFARLPWKEETSALFGADGKTRPPDMIIQDELHLISGPLGTIAGLYETAIDRLCRNGGKRVKVIASTATIRSARDQVRQLFDRDFTQFPPPLLDARDSFFAKENRQARNPRKYVGVFCPSKTGMTSFIRATGCLMHAPFADTVDDDTVKDAYWTLMAYFNSLRELGGANVRIGDDVVDFLSALQSRDGLPHKRDITRQDELTSRKSSDELDVARAELWRTLPDDGDNCLDIVTCSNMVSVGLDVPRLGLMEVVGQPKTTAEYIQATSRIGRQHPGLVVTLYSAGRSRDRSHYERFRSYHGRLYAEVEATSVTPFSSRARDRALHAALITLVRHMVHGMSKNTSARDFAPGNDVGDLVDYILQRIHRCDEKEHTSSADQLNNDIVGKWARLATTLNNPRLCYKHPQRADRSLMVSYEDGPAAGEAFRTLNSMRNVDVTAGVEFV